MTLDPYAEVQAIRERIADIERRASGPDYVAPEVAAARRLRLDDALAAQYRPDEGMEATLQVEREHPDIFARLPAEVKVRSALYEACKAAAARDRRILGWLLVAVPMASSVVGIATWVVATRAPGEGE